MRVHNVGTVAAEEPGKPEYHPRPQARWLVEGIDRPAARLDVFGHPAPGAQGYKSQVKPLRVGVPRELDEQLLHPADIKLKRHVDDSQASIALSLSPHRCVGSALAPRSINDILSEFAVGTGR
jgi:hypothetical protein